MLQTPLEAILNEEVGVKTGIVTQKHVEDATRNLQRDVKYHPEERGIGDRAKAAMKQRWAKELATAVEKLLDDILRALYNNTQIRVRLLL